MNLYETTVPVFTTYLHAMERWLDKATAYAQQKNFDPEVLVQARLAPDQFPLLRQMTAACDTAKWAAAKLAGQQGPAHPDTETTLAELRTRLKTVIEYLGTFKPEDFAGAEERLCQHAWMQGKSVRGSDYVKEYALPNFLFHATTAYQILRHNGVALGKMDFIPRPSLV
jgi:uncharacterized protein